MRNKQTTKLPSHFDDSVMTTSRNKHMNKNETKNSNTENESTQNQNDYGKGKKNNVNRKETSAGEKNVIDDCCTGGEKEKEVVHNTSEKNVVL